MLFLRQWLLILSALVLCGGQLLAASALENREYARAAAAFKIMLYDRAEDDFAQFVEKYPNSDRFAEAVLLQAQAALKQDKFTNAIALLTDTNNLAKAGPQADEYFNWTGEAHYLGTNYTAAAATWIALAQKFPQSPLALTAVVKAASALAKIPEWPQTVKLLEETNGVFQRARQMQPDNELVARGELLLARAKFDLKDFTGASALLEPLLELKTLKPELGRQGGLLLYQVKNAMGETDAALAVTTNLLEFAQLETNRDWTAEGLAWRAGALEKLGRTNEAIVVYQENLTNAPVERQREAVLKIAELAIAQNQFSLATNSLGLFLAQYPGAAAADVALLTLGELELKRYAVPPLSTNQLAGVRAKFDQFIGTFTNSPLLGKAYLDRGWCDWLAGNMPDSLADFNLAAQKLPSSVDQAVAKFKAGDARFKQGDFAGARADYQSVLDDFTNLPAVGQSLGEPAAYQNLRACLELHDYPGANQTLARILRNYPKGDLSDNAILLVVESVNDSRRPEVARALLQQFEKQFPDSELLPQARLAVARTYEQDQNWPAAVTNYDAWLNNFPTNALRPQASYALAWANFQAGNETNALMQFTNFVTQFPAETNLAPLAQWWVADHYFRAGDFVTAERNYKNIFQSTNWPGSTLASRDSLYYPAQLMAGRAAIARQDYKGAIGNYFTKLETDTNCPIDLRVQATFAQGDALMRSDSTDTNNPLANFAAATNVFSQIIQLNPTNEQGLLAWFYIGECSVQLGSYDAATNAYAQVFDSPSGTISARSQAKIGFGIALEKMASALAGTSRTNLLNQALDIYDEVKDENEYNKDHQLPFDDFWLKKAYLQAAPLVGVLYDVDHQITFYEGLKTALPQLTELADQKISALSSPKN